MKRVKRMVVLVVGSSVLLVGVTMMVLPGPAFVAIPLGLAILAAEFAWARRWLRSARALLPLETKSGARPRIKRVSLHSVRRSAEFLLRQARRTLCRKRNPCASRL